MFTNIFQYLYDTKAKPIPFLFKLINNLPLTEDELIVNDDLNLRGSKIKYLPDNLTVNGSLNLARSEIKSLPDNLTVNGNLNLARSEIKSLPDNLIVNGYLDLNYNYTFSCLPNNITIKGNLYITETNIYELAEDLIIGGDLWCINTPLAYKIINDISLLIKFQKQIKGEIIYEW